MTASDDKNGKAGHGSRRQFLRGLVQSFSVLTLGGMAANTACRSDRSEEKENPYEYDLGRFAHVDSRWLKYDEITPMRIDMEILTGLATDSDDHIIVVGDRRMQIFGHDGVELSRFVLERQPRCVAVSPDKKIYLGMTDQVQAYDFEGRKRKTFRALDREAIITSITATDSDVIVADAGNKTVLRYGTGGEILNRIGDKDPRNGIRGLIIPSPYFDVAIGYEGHLWVANTGRHTLENYTFEGRLRSSWGKASWGIEGFCGCCNPTHFTLLPDGRFVTSEKGLARVKVYDQAGRLESVVAGPDQFDEGTVGLDLAVDRRGRILVLDPRRRAVRRFAEKNQP